MPRTLKSITVAPSSIVSAPNQTHALAVTAKFADGTERDVTRLTAFQSNEAPIAAVDEAGLVTAGESHRRGSHHGAVHGTDRGL